MWFVINVQPEVCLLQIGKDMADCKALNQDNTRIDVDVRLELKYHVQAIIIASEIHGKETY